MKELYFLKKQQTNQQVNNFFNRKHLTLINLQPWTKYL